MVSAKPTTAHANTPHLSLDILARTFDDMPVGVGIFLVEDLNDITSIRYVFMNKIVLYEMRKTKEEVFGKRIMDVAPEAYEHEGGKMVIETYRKVAAEGGSVNLGLVEYSNHMVAGTYECSVHHITGNYVYVMLRNVTELEQTKNELEEKNRELSQFASMASHDLKEPLNTITGFIDFLSEHYADALDEEAKSLMGHISETTGRMHNLINTLMEYSSLGEGKQRTSVNLEEILQAISLDLTAKIKETGARISYDTLPTVQGFRTELRLLLQNLISNAIKYATPNQAPKISITAKKEDSWIIAVQDNGIGIAKAHQAKIFSIFERIRSNKQTEGAGIGLAHCKKIVELHNGKIWVESEVGKGSTFYFTLEA